MRIKLQIVALMFAWMLIGSCIGKAALAFTVTWNNPTKYTTGETITTTDRAKITGEVQSSSTGTGGWTPDGATAAGVTTIQVSDPAPGATKYVRVRAALNGQNSEWATVTKTVPFLIPGPVTDLKAE